jgi:hypothetical protein
LSDISGQIFLRRNPVKLDGTEKIPTPAYDAHEQRVRAPHTHNPETGYVKAADAPEATVAGSHDDPAPATVDGEVQEYPKHITLGEGADAVTVVAHSAEEEAKFKAAADAPEDEPVPAAKPSAPAPKAAAPAPAASTSAPKAKE